jgi:hypothetical protein
VHPGDDQGEGAGVSMSTISMDLSYTISTHSCTAT